MRMNKKDTRSTVVRIRSQRRYRAVTNAKGNIYLPSHWVGMKVKVVRLSLWVGIIKRIHNLERKIVKIRKVTNAK